MRCLFLHCKTFSYRLDHPTPIADPIEDMKAEACYEGALIMFVAVESTDTVEMTSAIAKDIRKIARKAETNTIVINPFAHLSSTLAAPDLARAVLKSLQTRLAETWDGTIHYTGFGWYKAFTTDVEGHENSQIFRSY